MLFVVSGRDKPGNITERLRLRTQHRAHYENLGPDLLLSGPYLDVAGEPIGSLIIMRRPSPEAADAFAHADPYVIQGVFESLTVWRWDWFMNRPTDLTS